MNIICLGAIFFQLGWWATMFFFWRTYLKGSGQFLETILSIVLTGASSWVLGLNAAIWICAFEAAVVIFCWVKKDKLNLGTKK